MTSFFPLVLLLFATMSECSSVSKCTCVVANQDNPTPIEQVVQRALASSDAVFVGRVVEGQLVKNEPRRNTEYYIPAEHLEFTFSVSEHWKGVDSSIVKVQTGLGDGDCGLGFKLGYNYVVYAKRITAGTEDSYLYTGICDRTAKAGNEDVRILRRITRD